MNKQEQKRLEARQQILDAAVTVFAQKGLYAASMTDIMRASGLSKGGIYWHFQSKDEIITAILEDFFTQEMGKLSEQLTAVPSPIAQLRLIIQQTALILEQRTELLPITLDFYAAATRDEQMKQVVSGYFAQYRTLFAAIIEQGIAQGELRPVDSSQTAVAISAQIEGSILMWLINPQQFVLHEQLDAALEMLLQGVAVS